MLLKNLMEEKQQLNYDQPLLSVRRFSSMAASEKDNERKTDKSGIPRLPLYKTELKSGPLTSPGTVPFLWEQRPGQPKEEMKPHNENSDRPPIAPKLPPGKSSIFNKSQARNVPRDVLSVRSQDEDVNNFERCNKTIEKESSHSEHSDESYADALDTFSSTESIFFNCSSSGLSSLDELEVKQSGTFSTDSLTRDFMMDRFLPAATAMTSDTPQFATKKQPIVQEKPRQLKKIINLDKPSMQHGPSLVKHYLQFQDNEEEEEEESDDDYDQHGNFPAACGLLLRFCLNSSFCLIHPVTAMSTRNRLPKYAVNKLHDRSSAASSSFSKRVNESRSNFYDRNSVGNQISLRTDFNSNTCQRQNTDGSLLGRQLKEQNTSKSFDESPNKEKGQIIFPEETKNQGTNGFGSHKKGHKTFRDFLSEKDSSEESYSGIPVVEKTLCLNAVQKVKSPSREPFFANMQGSNEQPGSREKEHEVVTKMMDQSPSVDYSLKDTDKLETVDGANLLPDSQKYDIVVESSTSNSNQKGGIEASKDSTTAANMEVTDKKATECLQKQTATTEDRENFHQSGLQFPVPPPSPISPSESWLQQNLPSMSTKNSYKRSHLRAAENPQNQVFKDKI